MIRPGHLIWLLAVTAILSVGPEAGADPKVYVKTQYYEIRGGSANELRTEMDRKSQVRHNGRTFDAYTSWHVSWRFNWTRSTTDCKIADVATTAKIEYTLPKWVSFPSVDPALNQKWHRYFQALQNHEYGHKEFGLRAAKDIERAILEMGPRQTCTHLESDANALADNILKRYILLDDEYDERTNYGQREGAVFP